MAEGSTKASEIVGKGSERYSVIMKGQELFEPLRAVKGWALGVIGSARGGGRMRGSPQTEFHKISPQEGEKYYGVPTAGDLRTHEGKAKRVVYCENYKAVVDCLGICAFLTQHRSSSVAVPEDLVKLYTAATGRPTTTRKLMMIGERITNIEKVFNVREGMMRANDMPPKGSSNQ